MTEFLCLKMLVHFCLDSNDIALFDKPGELITHIAEMLLGFCEHVLYSTAANVTPLSIDTL